MNKAVFLFLFFLSYVRMSAQEPRHENAESLEMSAAHTETEQENDEWQQQWQYLLRSPLNVNRVKEEELKLLPLEPLQITSFLHYRNLFGPFLSKYELQAVPYWDHVTIRKLLPYLSFHKDAGEEKKPAIILQKGQHQVLVRSGGIPEKSRAYRADSAGARKYVGSALRLFFRYTYQFKQQFWMGITGEKDAGESFGRKKPAPVDFLSFHVFVRRSGFIRTIALGDYTLNIGQGLIQWQGLAFGKTGEAISVYRQGNILQPYRSAGEWNFHRGLALQAGWKKLEITLFGSLRNLSANLITDSMDRMGFSSISESGYHRSSEELGDRKNLGQLASGMVAQFIHKRFRAGISYLQYRFSQPYIPREEPYNLYAFRGSHLRNAAIHYSYTIRNLFLFGEFARSKGGMALVNGAVISLHPAADLSVVYRDLSPGFQSLYSRTFSEQSAVNNEKGLYLGLRLRPLPGVDVQAYADHFSFPWLRFRSDAPANGQEYLLHAGWIKRRSWKTYLRLRWSEKPENQLGAVLNSIQMKKAADIRLHIERTMSRLWQISSRFDRVVVKKSNQRLRGWGLYLDTRYQFSRPSVSVSARCHYFDTEGYDTRIYAYERDLLYSFSIPAFYDRGWRYYLQVQGKLAGLKWWVRWSQTHYAGQTTIGSGWDEISGSRRSEWKCQFMYTW